MENIVRREAPQILLEKGKEWGSQYRENRIRKPGFKFQWPRINEVPLNQIVLPLLIAQTRNHCSYCDIILRPNSFTIDHFRPKSIPEFYDLVCQWENLFAACEFCQKVKREQFDDLLLKPDDPDYYFDRYFSYNYIENKLYPRADLSELDKSRVLKTIEILGLNHTDNVKARERENKLFMKSDFFIQPK